MKKRTRVILIACAILLLAAAAAVLLPFTRKIDTTLTATEYRLDAPDYAVEHTVAIRGYDTRNLLGRGKFEGTFAVSGFETAGDGWTAHVTFPAPDTYWNISFEVPDGFGYMTGKDIYSLLADRQWSSLVALLPEEWTSDNGAHHASFDPETGRFLVSGPSDRDTALTLARELSRGTSLEPVFTAG